MSPAAGAQALERPRVDAPPPAAPSPAAEFRPQAGAAPDLARDLGWVLRAVWRQRALIAFVGALGVAAAVALVLALPDRYTATGRLSVSPDVVAGETGELAALPQAQTMALDTEVQALWDGGLLVETARRLDLLGAEAFSARLADHFREQTAAAGGSPPDPHALQAEIVAAFAEAMRVGVLGQSRIVEVSVETLSPTLSADVVNTLLELHAGRRKAATLAALEASARAIEGQIAAMAADLADVEREVGAREAEVGGAADAGALDTALAEVERRLIDVGARVSAAEAALAAADAASPPAQSAEAAGFQQLLAEQASARATLEAVGRIEGARSREFLLAQQALAAADAAVDAARAAIRRSREEALAQALAERDSLVAAREALRAARTEAAARAAALQPLRRDRETRAAALLGLQSYADRIAAQRAAWTPNVVVVSPAIAPTRKSGPDRKLVVGAGAVVAGALAAMLALLAEALRGTVGGARDVERDFGAPALGTLPRPPAGRAGARSPASLAAAPAGPYARALRALAYAVFQTGATRGVLLVAELGPPPRRGGPALCLALGHALAADGRRTAVVTARGDAARVDPDAAGAARLAVIAPAGAPPTGDAARAQLQELRQRFDVVLVDAGDEPEGPDARVHAPLADASVLAVRRDRTRRAAAASALREMSGWPARLLGVVVLA